MPLYEITDDELVPFRRLHGGADLYESEIEDLLWASMEEMTGETLFPVARQARLSFGGIPDVVALDGTGQVVVFEVKRDVDRRQLAQCLEYAGWGRKTSLDELAGMYHRGPDQFWADWQEFTETDTPKLVDPHPRLVLVAREFQSQTESAFDYLIESGVDVRLVRVSLYEDQDGRRFMDVEGDHEPEWASPSTDTGTTLVSPGAEAFGKRIKIEDLVEHDLLLVGDRLVWERPKKGTRYEATVIEAGIRLPDGREFWSPSGAACAAADIPAYDGWHAWEVTRTGDTLHDVRMTLVERVSAAGETDSGIDA